jgi:hypothetical protein
MSRYDPDPAGSVSVPSVINWPPGSERNIYGFVTLLPTHRFRVINHPPPPRVEVAWYLCTVPFEFCSINWEYHSPSC